MKKISAIYCVCILFSCENNTVVPVDFNNLLIGNWQFENYEDEATTFVRTSNLPEENSGISFQENAVFIERTSGWCGTPPLSFYNVEGTWEETDNIVHVSMNSYAGSFSWRIVSVTPEKLIVKRELTEQEIDHRALMELYNEISTIAYSVSCTDANDWSFTSYGSKAFGGPQGYIAYSTQIDIDDFLEKVSIYTAKENEYNIKWGIVSTCDVSDEPTGVVCQNGYPMLQW